MGHISKTVEQQIAQLERDAKRRYPNDPTHELSWVVGGLRGILRAVAIEADVLLQPDCYSARIANGISAEDAHDMLDAINTGLGRRYVDRNPVFLQDAEAAISKAGDAVLTLWDEVDPSNESRPVDECDLAKREAA